MFVGKTHSGKTTIAKELEKRFAGDYVVLDMDEIDLFTKNSYPALIDFEKNNREFYDEQKFIPFLKLRIQNTVFRYTISVNKGVLLSNGNSTPKVRQYQKETAESIGCKLVAVNLHISDEMIRERIQSAQKDTSVHTVSKSMSSKSQFITFMWCFLHCCTISSEISIPSVENPFSLKYFMCVPTPQPISKIFASFESLFRKMSASSFTQELK